MKNEKLNLEDLKVNSFVTVLDSKESVTLVGGATEVCQSGNYRIDYPEGTGYFEANCDIQVG
jgi:hypothetical protein